MTAAASEGPNAEARNKAGTSPADRPAATVAVAQNAHVQPKLRAKKAISARLSRAAERVLAANFVESVIPLSAFSALAPLGVRVTIAGHAVVDVADAFFEVFADQVGLLVLVTTEAGELGEIARRGVA